MLELEPTSNDELTPCNKARKERVRGISIKNMMGKDLLGSEPSEEKLNESNACFRTSYLKNQGCICVQMFNIQSRPRGLMFLHPSPKRGVVFSHLAVQSALEGVFVHVSSQHQLIGWT